VGSGYGRFEVLGGVRLTCGGTIEALSLHRGPEYADKAIDNYLAD